MTPGSLVTFSPIDYGVEIEVPTGYVLKLDAIYMWKKHQAKGKYIIPKAESIGFVVSTYETIKESRNIKLTQVMIDGSLYWFESQFVVPLPLTEVSK